MALLFRLLGLLPLRLLHGLGTFFGWVAYLASPTYRRHLKENLALAYDPDEATAILPAAVAHAGRGVLELPWLWTRPKAEVVGLVTQVTGWELIEAAWQRGDGILFVSFNGQGEATAYFDVELWPQWSIAKFGGAVKAERQGRGFGGACGLAAVEWCFDQLGVARICETTARDNDRSIRLLSRLGFVQHGEVVAIKPDGSTRPSLYWELEREAWDAARSIRRTG